jgi:hypothetical protein
MASKKDNKDPQSLPDAPFPKIFSIAAFGQQDNNLLMSWILQISESVSGRGTGARDSNTVKKSLKLPFLILNRLE